MTTHDSPDLATDAADAPAPVSRRRFATIAALIPAIAAGGAVTAESASADPAAVRRNRAGNVGIGTREPDAPLHVEGDQDAIVGHSNKFGVQGAGAVGVHGEALGAGAIGVYGYSGETRGRAIGAGARGAESLGVQVGVAGHHSYGVFSEAGGTDSSAVYAVAHEPRSHGVYGTALGHDSAGIFADAREDVADAHAFWAAGRSHVNADATHAASGFKIDHPDNPAGQYLAHAGVESDERKNVYDGVAHLDGAGRAVVRLPKWFESLNADARYQLTAIGAAMPNLHVARPIEHNQFEIAGGVARQQVSWQVTGVRQDIWSASHPLQVEESKPQRTVGRLLHPELHAGTHEAVHPRPTGPAERAT